MNTRKLILAFAALASISSAASAQYSMSWSTIDCGGGIATGTSPTNVVYTMTHVIGQPDAGPRMTGGTMKLDGGFLPVGIAVPPPCPTDLNHDGATNTIDLTQFLGAFGQPGPNAADFNNDGAVNTADLVQFLGAFGHPCT